MNSSIVVYFLEWKPWLRELTAQPWIEKFQSKIGQFLACLAILIIEIQKSQFIHSFVILAICGCLADVDLTTTTNWIGSKVCENGPMGLEFKEMCIKIWPLAIFLWRILRQFSINQMRNSGSPVCRGSQESWLHACRQLPLYLSIFFIIIFFTTWQAAASAKRRDEKGIIGRCLSSPSQIFCFLFPLSCVAVRFLSLEQIWNPFQIWWIQIWGYAKIWRKVVAVKAVDSIYFSK